MALKTFTFGDTQSLAITTKMTEGDFYGKELGASGGIIMLAAFLPKCT